MLAFVRLALGDDSGVGPIRVGDVHVGGIVGRGALEGQLSVAGEVSSDDVSRQVGDYLSVAGSVDPHQVNTVLLADEGGIGEPALVRR